MSYMDTDHAGWVQRQITIHRSERPGQQVVRQPNRLKGWAAAPLTLDLFQEQVCDVVGIVGGGIWNAPIDWSRVRWGGDYAPFEMPWYRALTTYDDQSLTDLVFLCHVARIRCTIAPENKLDLVLSFWPRVVCGNSYVRHPGLDEAVQAMDDKLPTWHRLRRSRAVAPQAPQPVTDGVGA